MLESVLVAKVLSLRSMYRLKPILETASRIHSANGGVRASQARDEVAVVTAVACLSNAIFSQATLTISGEAAVVQLYGRRGGVEN